MTKLPKIDPMRLAVSADGIFFTLQGEGDSIGKPAVFIRLHLCNLNCIWCDTPYTWNKDLPEYWNGWSYQEIEETTKSLSEFTCRRLVITGGEPLLQQEAIKNLLKLIPEWTIEIETNGTIQPLPELLEKCQFNVSPKLANSGIKEQKRLNVEALSAFSQHSRSYFKFVVASTEDLSEVSLLTENLNLNPEKIIIMPEGTNQQILSERMILLAEKCKKLAFGCYQECIFRFGGMLEGFNLLTAALGYSNEIKR